MRNVVIVSGSPRPNSQSSKVGHYFANRMLERKLDVISQLIDLSKMHFPDWDDSYWQTKPQDFIYTSEQLSSADGFIIVTPEWSGMVPPQLMSLFLLCNDHEIAHKPALIVSVSSGQNGAYPILQLRSHAYKNNKICFIPEHIIVKDVNHVLNEQTASSESDEWLRKRIDFSLDLFMNYIDALRGLRETTSVNFKDYPYGM